MGAISSVHQVYHGCRCVNQSLGVYIEGTCLADKMEYQAQSLTQLSLWWYKQVTHILQEKKTKQNNNYFTFKCHLFFNYLERATC